MTDHAIRALLQKVQKGETDIESALRELRAWPFEDLGFAKVDHHRALRRGFPEVVFCQGKTESQVAQIVQSLAARSEVVLATRATRGQFEAVQAVVPTAVYHETARIIQVGEAPPPDQRHGTVLVLTAGTADIPVAQEALVTLAAAGVHGEPLFDVGVAGIHRLLHHRERLEAARVLVVVAGMEGALASVVAGLVDKPVIAVPTSVGYGASFEGLAALLAMLNACASGVTVVNIDNGFGAGYSAAMLARM